MNLNHQLYGHNVFNFDFNWIFERSKILGLDIKKICRSLNPGQTIKQSESMLKLANEVEKFIQASIWGYNVIDTLHSVRRGQAINSNIKSAGLKYITQYIEAELLTEFILNTIVLRIYTIRMKIIG